MKEQNQIAVCSMRVKTNVNAGGLSQNHNETLVWLNAGGLTSNQNQMLVCDLPNSRCVRINTQVKASGTHCES